MSDLISPIDCKHRHTSLLQAGSVVSTEEHSRYQVTLCHDCGQFMIRGMMNEQYYSIDFTLVREEDLEAAGKAVAYYSEGDDDSDSFEDKPEPDETDASKGYWLPGDLLGLVD